MKKVSRILSLMGVALASSVAITACGGGNYAHAAPVSVANSSGTIMFGTEKIISLEKDTASGNRVKARYSSAGGTMYVADDAAWSRYAKLRSGLSVPVDALNLPKLS